MLSSTTRISLLAAVVVLAACSDTTSPIDPVATVPGVTPPERPWASASDGGAVRDVEESLYDMSGSFVAVQCDDGRESELVALEGQIFERFTVVYNPAGGIHVGFHAMPVGLRGVGVESAEEYRAKEQEHGSYGQTTMGAVGSYRQTVRLVGRTSRRSFSLVSRGHYTVNANGEIVVQRDRLITECDA